MALCFHVQAFMRRTQLATFLLLWGGHLSAAMPAQAAEPPIGPTTFSIAPEQVELLQAERALPAHAQLPDGSFGLGWIDLTHSRASAGVNRFTDQFDRFLGEPRSDLEAAYSSLRLRLEHSWFDASVPQEEGSQIRLGGRVHLPRLSERLSLIFTEDDGDGSSFFSQFGPEGRKREETRPNLEVKLSERNRSRLDFRVGLRSSLALKGSLRYRYDLPQGDEILHRFTQTLSWVDGTLGSRTRYEFNKQLSETRLIRLTSDWVADEAIPGSRWSSQLSYNRLYDKEQALIYFVRAGGQTSPRFASTYDIGLRWRRNIGRPWLFVELEPGHGWVRPAFERSREGSFFLIMRLEIALGTYQQ